MNAGRKIDIREFDRALHSPRWRPPEPEESPRDRARRRLSALFNAVCPDADPNDSAEEFRRAGHHDIAGLSDDEITSERILLRIRWALAAFPERVVDRTACTLGRRGRRASTSSEATVMPERTSVSPSDAAALEPEHLTDLGNARRLVRKFGADIRYIAGLEQYHIWDGARFAADDTRQIYRYAKQIAEDIYREAATETDERLRKDLARHAMQSESARAIRAMVELAKSERPIIVPAAAMDRDPLLLNCLNGTIDLEAGRLREHRQDDLITKLVDVDYDPSAECPTFLRFLEKIFSGRAELIRFLQKAIGYALTGLTIEQVFFVLHGIGANGKSTLTQTIRTLLAGYAATIAADSLLAKKGDGGSLVMNDLFGVQGARFVVAAESDMGRRLAEGLVKSLTGGEGMKVKKLYSDLFEIAPQFKLFLSTNHRPVIRGVDQAIWRRIREIPFKVVIPDEQQDHRLMEKLQAERPGILAWAVEGCLAWQREGLGMPDEVRIATAAYRDEMDTLRDFLTERCVLERSADVTAGDLYAAYLEWAKLEGEQRPLSKTGFGLQLKDRGYTNKKISGERGWRGLRLRNPMEPIPEDASEAVDAFEGGFPEVSPTRAYREEFQKTCPNSSDASEQVPW